MKRIGIVVSGLIFLASLSAHAGTEITEQKPLVTEKLPKPANIWVYDFAASPDDVPAESALAGEEAHPSGSQSADDVAEGRKVGAALAAALVDDIRALGMPAERATEDAKKAVNDIVIHGYLLSVSEGDEKKRLAVGFGSGASELKVAAEGFQMTAHGLRKLGSGQAESTGSKAPGAALGVVGLVATHNPIGLIVSTGMKVHGEKSGKSTVEGRESDIAKEIAGALEKRFVEQGWIEKK
jgi:hypothetical protein